MQQIKIVPAFRATQVLAGPHKGQTLPLDAGGAEVHVGRNAPKKKGLRLDQDFEVSDRCVRGRLSFSFLSTGCHVVLSPLSLVPVPRGRTLQLLRLSVF